MELSKEGEEILDFGEDDSPPPVVSDEDEGEIQDEEEEEGLIDDDDNNQDEILIRNKEKVNIDLEDGEVIEEGEVVEDFDEFGGRKDQAAKPICRFFSKGQCTWGSNCRFLHPGVTDKGLYKMFDSLPILQQVQQQDKDTYIGDFVPSVELDEKELELLNKGLKFCLPRTRPPIDEIVVDIMASTKKLMEEEKDEINEESLKALKKLRSYKVDEKALEFKNTARSLRKKPIVISKADKSNNVVILDEEDYKNRMLQMIEESNYERLEKDPINSMKTQVDKILKEHGEVLCNDPKKELKKWKNSNPKVTRLYGLAKTHKLKDLKSAEGLKLRPVASNVEAPTEKIAKWLVKEFKKLKPPKGKSVKNALEFVKAVENVRMTRNENMGSYDVVALYPSIPMDETMMLLKKWLFENNVNPRKINVYMDLTKLCMAQNIFMYNGVFYIQKEGTAIGNALSGFIAEIYMCAFETKIENHKFFPRVYVRFMDDIFSIQNARRVKETLQLFNAQHPKVQFTYEQEKDGKISFLDTLVKRKDDGKLIFEVYRKSCTTERRIVAESTQDIKHKVAAYHSMSHRMVNLPLEKDAYEKERKTILHIGKKNGYKTESIERIIRKHEKKKELLNYSTFYGLPKEKDESIKRISMEYCPEVTKILKPIYRKFNLEIVHRSSNNLQQHLKSLKDPLNNLHKSGIYIVRCQDGCEFIYIGRSVRRILIRFNEHLEDWINDDENASAVSEHLLKNNHEINVGHLSLLKEYNNAMKIDYIEAVYLNKYKNKKLMNKNLGKISPLLALIKPVKEKETENKANK